MTAHEHVQACLLKDPPSLAPPPLPTKGHPPSCDMFKLVHLGHFPSQPCSPPPPAPDLFKLVRSVVYTSIEKWVVGLRLKRHLVLGSVSEPTLSMSADIIVSFDKASCCPYVLLLTSTAAQAFQKKTCVLTKNDSK